MTALDPWYLENLVCPIDRDKFSCAGRFLRCLRGHAFPVVDGMPVLLRDDVPQTPLGAIRAALARAQGKSEVIDRRAPDLYLESLGLTEEEKLGILRLAREGGGIDPVANYAVAGTGGSMYRHLRGRLTDYPIPELRLPDAHGETFLEIGCHWGRWCVAAARKGYTVVGLEPTLAGAMAARRIMAQLGLKGRFVVADGRYLPFKDSSFHTVFSYSVLQHLDKADVRMILAEAARVLAPEGRSLIQMPHKFGVRSLYNQMKTGFQRPRNFDIRYWTVPELAETFERLIGPSDISVHCYFGLGLEESDLHLMPAPLKLVLLSSRTLRRASERLRLLRYAADSLYVASTKR